MAWHAFPAANPIWYGIEHADNGKPDNPLTDAQLTSSALVFEFLSGFAGFPLQVATRITGRGYAAHYMGGAAWGGHSCPDQPPAHVRSNQRDEIVLRAHKIRNPPAGVTRYEITGTLTVNGHLVDASGVMQVGGVA
jgi:hypothetical protein